MNNADPVHIHNGYCIESSHAQNRCNSPLYYTITGSDKKEVAHFDFSKISSKEVLIVLIHRLKAIQDGPCHDNTNSLVLGHLEMALAQIEIMDESLRDRGGDCTDPSYK